MLSSQPNQQTAVSDIEVDGNVAIGDITQIIHQQVGEDKPIGQRAP